MTATVTRAISLLNHSLISDRLLRRRVITTSGCWEFISARHRVHASMSIKGARYAAHILSALLWIGLPPSTNSIVCHHCDNRACFNPAHLYYGTFKTNSKDMMERQRGIGQFTSDNKRGSKHHMARLSETDVLTIRKRIATEEYHGMLTDLAREYRVTIQEISRIKYRRVWGWLECV